MKKIIKYIDTDEYKGSGWAVAFVRKSDPRYIDKIMYLDDMEAWIYDVVSDEYHMPIKVMLSALEANATVIGEVWELKKNGK